MKFSGIVMLAMRLFRAVQLLVLGVVAVLFESCQTATPSTRISQNPVMYSMLTPEQQVLVQQGRICEGMSKDAVYLAWGNPSTPPVTGQQDGASYEKWIYTTYQPVMVDSFGVGVGCGHGPHWHGGGIATSTAYVPRESAWVMFQNNKVTAWEERR